jgi:hypothetical protein
MGIDKFLYRENLISEVLNERDQQDERWGGLRHDKNHSSKEWSIYIKKHLERWETETGNDKRYAMIRVAALALAAIESYDNDGLCKFEDSEF